MPAPAVPETIPDEDKVDESAILNVMGIGRTADAARDVVLTPVPGTPDALGAGASRETEPPAASAVTPSPPRKEAPGTPPASAEGAPAAAPAVWQSPSDEPTVDEMLTDFARLFRETKRLRRLREIDEIKTATADTVVDEVRRLLSWSKALFAAESERMEELPPETQELFYQIAAKSPLLERLCADLMEFTQLVDEDFALPVEPGDVIDAARESMEEVRALATVKQIELTFHTPPAPLVIPFSAPKIVELLRQLLANSVKFTPKGGRVGIEIRDLPTAAEITVHDTGRAVSADPGSVFIRFRGVSDSLSSKIKGRGIRMPIVQSVIEAHGGRLTIQGVEDVGNRFTFTLPKIAAPTRRAADGDEGEGPPGA